MDDPELELTALPHQTLQQAWDWLDAQEAVIRQALIRWCGQNSWSYSQDGLTAMAAQLAHDFEPLGLLAEQVRLPPLVRDSSTSSAATAIAAPGLIWHHRPTASRRALLLIHYDTVYPPTTHQAVTVAGALRSRGGTGQRLIGPGVADAKGGIAVLRYAAEALLRFGIGGELGWSIAINPDEEIGSPSSAAWLAELASDYEFALVFEPALPDGAMVANRKGTGNWRLNIGGRAAHAGRNPEQGRNALVHAARLAIELDALNDPAAGITVNVGRMEGGGALNQVPDRATLELNVRVVEQRQADQVASQLRRLCDEFGQIEGYRCDLQGRFHSPPKRIDARYANLHRQFELAAGWLGRKIQWRDTGGACDGSKLAASGLINIDTMGPTGGELHSPGEYCDFDSLLIAAKTLVNFMAIKATEGT